MEETSHPAKAGSSQAAPKDTRPLYEVGFHLVPTLEESALAGVVNTLHDRITKAGGEVVREQFPAKTPLTYVIERSVSGKREKYGESYFGWAQFVAMEKEGIPGLETFLQQSKEVLRYLLIHTTYENTAAQRRAVFSSNRLEGETIKKPADVEEGGEVSEADLDKSIDALVGDEKEA